MMTDRATFRDRLIQLLSTQSEEREEMLSRLSADERRAILYEWYQVPLAGRIGGGQRIIPSRSRGPRSRRSRGSSAMRAQLDVEASCRHAGDDQLPPRRPRLPVTPLAGARTAHRPGELLLRYTAPAILAALAVPPLVLPHAALDPSTTCSTFTISIELLFASPACTHGGSRRHRRLPEAAM